MTLDDLADLFSIADHASWMRWASCAETDPDLFHPEDGNAAQATQAKNVCQRCPVRETCLAYALEHAEDQGVWGGTSPKERRRLQLRDIAA